MPLAEAERNAAVRRALFVFAAGGPLNRDPTLEDPAVVELASDIDAPERRSALAAAIESLDADPVALDQLRDADTAWRAYACSLLAEALGESEDDEEVDSGASRPFNSPVTDERRSGGDRRTGDDRRSGSDRRKRDASSPSEGERRSGGNRRTGEDRRSGKDRRSGAG